MGTEAPTNLKRKQGAQVGNRNGLRSGLSVGDQKRVVLGRLPKGCGSIRAYTTALTNRLVALLVQARGGVSPLDAMVVDEIVRWEQHYLLAARWLRVNYTEMAPGERLNHSKQMAQATKERNRCLRELNLQAQDFVASALYDNGPLLPGSLPNATQRNVGA